MATREIKFRAWSPEDRCIYRYGEIKDWPIERLNSDKGWKYMQYTGLKDRNGKEIYEGDILKVENIWEVDYHDGCFWANCGDEDMPLFELLNCEVIGNIYQNKGLL